MCSILYTTKPTEYDGLSTIITKQLPRGEHSLGLVGGKWRIKWGTEETIKTLTYDKGAKKAIEYIKKFNEKYNTDETGFIMHMRKPSIGDNDIANAHPVKVNDEYVIIQNGTNKLITNYAKIAYKDFDSTRCDTYYLGRYLVDTMKNKNILQALSALKRMSGYDTVGIVFLVNTKTWTVLFYTDGARDCYIEHTKSHIWLITNYHPYDNDYKYKTTGHIIFNIKDGKIINKNISTTKTKKQHYRTYGNSTRDEYDHGYHYKSRQSILPKSFNPSPINKEYPKIEIDEYTMSKKKYKKLKKLLDISSDAIKILVETVWIHSAKKIFKNIIKYSQRNIWNKDKLLLTIESIEYKNHKDDVRELLDILSNQYSEKIEEDIEIWLTINF